MSASRLVVAFLVLLLASTTGCVFKDSIRYAPQAARPPETVDVLGGPPDEPFKVIGQVMIRAGTAASWDRIVQAAREEAASMGADAVFQGEAGMYSIGQVITPGTTYTQETTSVHLPSASATTYGYSTSTPTTATNLQQKRWTGLAIVYVEPAPAVAPAPPAPASTPGSGSAPAP
jgi:hypothetical protein